ncbi:MAG: chromate transporter [Oscillospiraceae bacterium]|nr:chromate transporter [Oscillospiraceae bacterium]
MIYLQLFWEFFKAGLFSVGGGLATLPFLYDISDRLGWFTHAQIADMLAISESTPGPIGVNMATYAGFTSAGIPGGIVATLGLVTPSVIVILIIAMFLKKFRDNIYVERTFYGLRPASLAMISSAFISILRIAIVNVSFVEETKSAVLEVGLPALALAVVVFILNRKTKLHPIWFILASAVVGILLKF